MIKFIITSFKELINLMDSDSKFGVIVMFKSTRCPPCIRTSNYLNTITSNGDTQWQKYAHEFQKEYGIPIYFFAIDASSQIIVDNDPRVLPIVSACNTVEGVPTFDLFLYESKQLKYFSRARRTGGMGPENFDIYLNFCGNFISK